MREGDEFEFIVFVNVEKGGVDGGAGHEGVAGLGEGFGDEGEDGDEATEVDDPFFLGCDVVDASEVGE